MHLHREGIRGHQGSLHRYVCGPISLGYQGLRWRFDGNSRSLIRSAGYISNIEIQALIAQANGGDNPDNVTISQYEDEGDVLVRTQWRNIPLCPPFFPANNTVILNGETNSRTLHHRSTTATNGYPGSTRTAIMRGCSGTTTCTSVAA